ncbi:MAG: chemotaxis-specific protein-glutamate methyltransferase CheB [Bdellovibrionaceae bacterium]|nr:chemotaxis-specific protein-glutamate methyltransferase CheB [Pseudobdellovibrionaceae bacterium]
MSLKITTAAESAEIVKSVVEQVSAIVSEMAGIQLGAKQAPMVENRLKTRMVRLGVPTFQGYLAHLHDNRESESQALLSLLTTHHTFFFREFSHFEFLLNKSLSCLIETARQRTDKTIHIWSAACSKGQEVYSLSMFFKFHLGHAAPDIKFHIWGTDIDPESVHHAKNGVYKADELKQSPAMYIDGNWIRGKGNVQDFSKAKDSLTQPCSFTTANLLDCDSFLKGKTFDIIFCRNVFIYFNQEQIKKITNSFMKHLTPSGWLFLGVSETLNGLGLDTDLVGPSVYQSKNRPVFKTKLAPVVTEKVIPARPLEVLSVDDSPVILTLLSKVLTAEHGFMQIKTAKNGREAVEILKNRKFDAITLDLHMPELDGLGFLSEYKDRSIPILVVSSVNRDDTSIAQKALSLGASDYVEKPSLENLAQAGNEIRSKIKTLIGIKKNSVASVGPMTSVTAPVSAASNMTTKKIKVLIVDDSATIRKVLVKILSKDPLFVVVAEAEKPSQVENLIKKFKPDLITLDIHMPEMDGVTLLKNIHPVYHIPTVMISSISKEDGPQVLQALEVGAVDYIQKPQMNELADAEQMIIDRLKVAASAKVIRSPRIKKSIRSTERIDVKSIVVMGASTGGTEALKVVLESMPEQIPPILVVQHIPPIFSGAFAHRLNSLCQFEVREAKDGDEVKPNLVLIAPGGKQMAIKILKDKTVVRINDDPPMNRHKPSVDYLFKSVAESQHTKVVAAILTGMGADGAAQMKVLRDSGAHTVAQDEQSCVVYGMPREAFLRGGVEFVCPLDKIGEKVLQLCQIQEMQKVKKSS